MAYKGVRNLLAKIYRKKCMMEEAGIREVPVELRRRIKGYKKSQEDITYHHIVKVSEGGEATVENGALLKQYNHAWLHRQTEEVQEEVNNKIVEYKLSVVEFGYEETKNRIRSGKLDFNISDLIGKDTDYIKIKAHNTRRTNSLKKQNGR